MIVLPSENNTFSESSQRADHTFNRREVYEGLEKRELHGHPEI